MGYDIFYGKKFIRLSNNEFCPIVVVGSSNCTEFVYRNGRQIERRERDWWNFTHILKGKPWGTLEEMLANSLEEREKLIKKAEDRAKEDPGFWGNDLYTDKSFGYHTALAGPGGSTRRFTFGMYQGIFKTGCAQAETVEALNEKGFGVHVKTGYIPSDLNLEHKCVFVDSEEQLKKAYEEISKHVEGTNVGVVIAYNKNTDRFFDQQRTENIIKRANNRKEKTYTETKVYFTVYAAGYGYVNKLTRNGYRYSPFGGASKKFLTEKQAIKMVEKLYQKFNRTEAKFTVERIESEQSVFI